MLLEQILAFFTKYDRYNTEKKPTYIVVIIALRLVVISEF
jgi:hypothetical protein